MKEVYIAVRVVRMACAALFAVTEFSVSKVTLDLISKPQDDMCLEMKLHLKGILSFHSFLFFLFFYYFIILLLSFSRLSFSLSFLFLLSFFFLLHWFFLTNNHQIRNQSCTPWPRQTQQEEQQPSSTSSIPGLKSNSFRPLLLLLPLLLSSFMVVFFELALRRLRGCKRRNWRNLLLRMLREK